MFGVQLVDHIKGYLEISVNGFFVERFINLCKVRNIRLWNLKRLGTHKILVNIQIKDFRKLISIVYKTKSHVRINKRVGWPFLALRFWKHKILLATTTLILTAIFVLSMFIWDIEITGNQKITTQNIVTELAESGLKIGAYRKNISPDYIRHQMTLKIPEISWIGIDIIGTRAYISVREREKEPILIDYDTPCDIYAPKSGVVFAIDVTNGTKLVKIGDTVEKGQILVKGEQRIPDTELIPSHAIAKITLKTWYEATQPIENDSEEALERAKKQLCDSLDSQIPEKTEVINKIFEEQIYSEGEIDKKALKGTYECLEEI